MISEISTITPLDEMDVSVRLYKLSSLKQGWLNGVGMPLSASFIQWLDALFENRYPPSIPSPYIYPTDDGGVSLEWDNEKYQECSMEIDPNTRIGSLYVLKQTEEEIFEDINLSIDGWKRIETLLSAGEGKGC